MANNSKCFVIGPIGDELAPIGDPERLRWEQAIETWEKVIEPACVEVGLVPLRADHIAKAGEITEQVFRLIRDSDVVIADVTGGNANVMYELGLRHTLDKITIQIGEYGKLPFDISVIRSLQFTRTPGGFVDGRKKLQAALAAALEGGSDPVTATRLWNPTIRENPATRVATEVRSASEVEEPGVLELLAEMEVALPMLVGLVTVITQSMEKMTARAESATVETQQSDAAHGGFAGRLRVADKLAAELSLVADELEAVADDFERQAASIDAGMTCLLDLIEQDPTQAKYLGSFPDVLQKFATTIRQTIKNQADFAVVVSALGRFSKRLRVSSKRIADATNRFTRAMERAEIWNSRLRKIIGREENPASGEKG